MNIFENAARLKLRFDTTKGQISAEDLWDLPLTSTSGRVNLDDIARGLHAATQSNVNVSFVHKDKKPDALVQLKFELVKHVIDVRIAEADAASLAQIKREKKQKIMDIINKKQDESLVNASVEDLNKMLADL